MIRATKTWPAMVWHWWQFAFRNARMPRTIVASSRRVGTSAKSAKVHREYAGFLLDRGKPGAAKGHLSVAQQLDPNARDTKALNGLMARYNRDLITAIESAGNDSRTVVGGGR